MLLVAAVRECAALLTLPAALSLRRTMGTPDSTTWPEVVSLPDYLPTFPKWPPKSLHKACPGLDDVGIDLLAVRACSAGPRFACRATRQSVPNDAVPLPLAVCVLSRRKCWRMTPPTVFRRARP